MVKILALFGAIFTGGSFALNNEEVDDTVEEPTEEVEEVTKTSRKRGRHNISEIIENGFPYPSDEFLGTLTEDQLLAVTTYIDEVNLTYDFSTMTDEELKDILGEIREGMKALFEEQGIELPERPAKSESGTKGKRGFRKGDRNNDDLDETNVEDVPEGTDEA